MWPRMTQEVAGRCTLDWEGWWEEEAGKDTCCAAKGLSPSVCLCVCVCGHDLLMLWGHNVFIQARGKNLHCFWGQNAGFP